MQQPASPLAPVVAPAVPVPTSIPDRTATADTNPTQSSPPLPLLPGKPKLSLLLLLRKHSTGRNPRRRTTTGAPRPVAKGSEDELRSRRWKHWALEPSDAL
ncbi:hypothetical protein DENSPDRAFT_845484 [Dentipellis sp. KUC8613]|nr:hypothetical protein DENSPDRAFT_845484 [Dentipellis sp. KUC8613]